MRYSCLQLARKHQAAHIQLYIRCPLQVALQRNALRTAPHRVLDSVMHRMDALFEEPNPHKHNWEANTIVLESGSWDGNSWCGITSCASAYGSLLSDASCNSSHVSYKSSSDIIA